MSTSKLTPKPNNAGKKWTELDHCKLLDLVETENTIEEVALKLERSVGGVKARLLKETYDLINTGDWTAEELSDKFKLSVADISRYQEREDQKKLNPPEKRTTRSETAEKKEEAKEIDSKRSFSTATKTRNVLTPLPKNITSKNIKNQELDIMPQTYNEQSLALLTEVRDLLRIIAAKK